MPGFENTLHEFSRGELHSGSKSGPVVTSRKQALAIAYHQAGQKDDESRESKPDNESNESDPGPSKLPP